MLFYCLVLKGWWKLDLSSITYMLWERREKNKIKSLVCSHHPHLLFILFGGGGEEEEKKEGSTPPPPTR